MTISYCRVHTRTGKQSAWDIWLVRREKFENSLVLLWSKNDNKVLIRSFPIVSTARNYVEEELLKVRPKNSDEKAGFSWGNWEPASMPWLKMYLHLLEF